MQVFHNKKYEQFSVAFYWIYDLLAISVAFLALTISLLQDANSDCVLEFGSVSVNYVSSHILDDTYVNGNLFCRQLWDTYEKE
jgi:hypothetical protein